MCTNIYSQYTLGYSLYKCNYSGAGKSTLMNALAYRNPGRKTTRILINTRTHAAAQMHILDYHYILAADAGDLVLMLSNSPHMYSVID